MLVRHVGYPWSGLLSEPCQDADFMFRFSAR